MKQADWIKGFAGTSSGEREAIKIVMAPIRAALKSTAAQEGGE